MLSIWSKVSGVIMRKIALRLNVVKPSMTATPGKWRKRKNPLARKKNH